jgi:hypothetical protein
MDETDQNSLASYLGIKHKKLRSLLLASGLASFHGEQFRLNPKQGNSVYSWEQFLVKQSLTVYFDVFTINRKHHYWIGLGSMEKVTVVQKNVRGIALPYTPGSQSKFYKTPPRLLQRKSRSMMLSLLDVYNEEIEKNEQADADDKQDDLDATSNGIDADDKQDDLDDTSNRIDNEDKQGKDMETNLRTSAQTVLNRFRRT